MHFKQIKQIARYNTSKSARHKDNTTVLDGLHLVEEVFIHAPESIQNVFFTDKAQKENPEIAAFLMKIPHIPHERVSGEIMQKISSTETPPGIFATISIPKYKSTTLKDARCIMILDHVSDPGNVGAIIRSSVALGADAIILSPGCADIWGPKVLRAAQGAHFSLPLLTNFDLSDLSRVFDGVIYGTFLDDTAENLYTTTFPERIGLCVGNEGAGIDPDAFASYGDKKIYIPMQRGFESLNVAMTASILLAERSRQLAL